MLLSGMEKRSFVQALALTYHPKTNKSLLQNFKRELAAVVTALKKHCETPYHKEKVSVLIDLTLNRIDSMLVDSSVDGRVHDAEMRMVSFISEHNLSFNVMDHFSNLLPKLYPDSEIAAILNTNVPKPKASSTMHSSLSRRTCAVFTKHPFFCHC